MKIIQVPKIDGEHPLDTVSRMVGGRVILAKSLDVSVAAVGNWKHRGVPIEKCNAIERMGQPAVTRRELRPDDWQDIWPELVQPQPQPEPTTPKPGVPVACLDLDHSDQERRDDPDRRDDDRREEERRVQEQRVLEERRVILDQPAA